MLKTASIDNHQISVDNLYVTGDLEFLVILLGKEFSSPKWCFKYKLNLKIWLEHEHKIGEYWTTIALRLVSESDCRELSQIGVKEAPIWEFVELQNYICPVLHNQINLGNNVLYNLLDYGNEYIEKLSSKEIIARNLLSVIDASIDEKITLRQDFDISDNGKRLTYLKTARRNDTTSIFNIAEIIDNRIIEIDD